MREQGLLLVLLAVVAGCSQKSATVDAGVFDAGLSPPVARRAPVSTTLHGDTRVDAYAWMKEKGTPELEAHLAAENAYTEAMLAPLAPLRAKLEAELIARRPAVVDSFPEREGAFEYWTRSDVTKPYEELLRRPLDGGSEQLVLDLNTVAPDASYVNLLDTDVSDDGARVAWAIDTSGLREFTLRVTELDGGARWPLALEHVTSFDWAADGRTLFFTTENAAKRSDKLYRLDPGHDAGVLVFEEKDEHFDVGVHRSETHRFLFLESGSLTTSETAVLDAKTPKGAFTVVLPRVQDQRPMLAERGDEFVVLSQDQGPEGRVYSVPLKNPRKGKQTEWVPRRPGVSLSGIHALSKHLVVWERSEGQLRPRSIEWATRTSKAFEAGAGRFAFRTQPTLDTTRYLYEVESPSEPPSIYERDLVTGETSLRWREPVNGFDPVSAEVLRVSATAKDGTVIPITLARKKGVGPGAPLYLRAYGAYGDAWDASFDEELLSLLQRGVVLAVAHVRGGGEFGDAWHDAGKMKTKMNTFTDFISCAEGLIAQDFTTPERLVINGGSAGGLLMGVVLNQRPDLFHAAYVEVPFVDVITTMLDASLPLTVPEFEEWGDPSTPEQYAWMRAYSPYENVKAQAYPSILVRSAYNDTQVLFHEPVKWVQQLRTVGTGKHPVLLWMSMDPAGHSGRTALKDVARDEAKGLSWLLAQWGLGE